MALLICCAGRNGNRMTPYRIGPAYRWQDSHYAVVGLHWHSWKASTAYGRGHYFGFGSYEADVTLYTVRTHNGQRYFRHLKVTASGHRTRYLT